MVRGMTQRLVTLGWTDGDDFAEMWTIVLSLLARDAEFMRDVRPVTVVHA